MFTLSTEDESQYYGQRRHHWQPARVIVSSDIADAEVTRRVMANCATSTVLTVPDVRGRTDRQILADALQLAPSTSDTELTHLGRTSLLLTDSTELFQQMAVGPAMERRCFNFLKILPYTGVCPYDCSYCWFKDPVLIPRVNVRFFERLPTALAQLRQQGRTPTLFTFTHYKTDCFTMEHLTGFCRVATEFFTREPGFGIQFLTKSDQVESLLTPSIASPKAIVTFSVNPEWITKHVDLATPPLSARLDAARRLYHAGFNVMLRVDPILEFDGWPAAYDEMVESIFQHFEPTHVTLGTPRFQDVAELTTVATRIPSARARAFMEDQASRMAVTKPGAPTADDSFQSYFKNMSVSYPDAVRVNLYRTVADAFRRHRPQLALGLCEEPAKIWDEVGIAWTGDKTRDCSCNFVPLAMRQLFTADEADRVALQTAEARTQDARIVRNVNADA